MPVGAAGPLWSECYLHRCGLIRVFAPSLSWITALKSKHYRVRPGENGDMREHTLSNTHSHTVCTHTPQTHFKKESRGPQAASRGRQTRTQTRLNTAKIMIKSHSFWKWKLTSSFKCITDFTAASPKLLFTTPGRIGRLFCLPQITNFC